MPTRELSARDLRTIALGGVPVEYALVRRRGRRGVSLRVDGYGLTVSAPLTMPIARVEDFVREHEGWVVRKLAEWSGRRVVPVAWVDGERLPYLGGRLALRLAAAPRTSARRVGDELHVGLPAWSPEGARRAVVRWYRAEARRHLAERVRILAQAAALPPPRLFISSAMSRWGSCNSRGEVRLAWRLMKAPAELVDYVVCHELAHLRHMDHSPAFWAEVARQCPDHRRLRERLLADDHLYRTF